MRKESKLRNIENFNKLCAGKWAELRIASGKGH